LDPQNRVEVDARGSSTVDNLQRKIRRLESELEKRQSSPERRNTTHTNTTTTKEDNKVQAEPPPTHEPYFPLSSHLGANRLLRRLTWSQNSRSVNKAHSRNVMVYDDAEVRRELITYGLQNKPAGHRNEAN